MYLHFTSEGHYTKNDLYFLSFVLAPVIKKLGNDNILKKDPNNLKQYCFVTQKSLKHGLRQCDNQTHLFTKLSLNTLELVILQLISQQRTVLGVRCFWKVYGISNIEGSQINIKKYLNKDEKNDKLENLLNF